jgi:hypothetical protein
MPNETASLDSHLEAQVIDLGISYPDDCKKIAILLLKLAFTCNYLTVRFLQAFQAFGVL